MTPYTPIAGQLRASARTVDVLLGFDLLGAAAPDNLIAADVVTAWITL